MDRPLCKAVEAKNEKTLQALLLKDAPVRDVQAALRTALRCRVWDDDMHGIALLLMIYGADVNTPVKRGGLSLVISTLSSAKDCQKKVRFLLSHGATFPRLHRAAFEGDDEALKRLFEVGGDVNETTAGLWTAAHVAAASGCTNALRLLKKRGANLSARDSTEATPAHYAALHGHRNALLFIAESGADLDAEDRHGNTPAHSATTSAAGTEVLRVLALNKVNLSVKNADKDTPAHFAARLWCPRMMRLLKASGADVAALNAYGQTPLDLAQTHRHKDIIRLLETDRCDLLSEEWTNVLGAQATALSGSPEVALLDALDEANRALEGPDGWAAPSSVIGTAAAAVRDIELFRGSHDALLAMMTAPSPSTTAQKVAKSRDRCCFAAQSLLSTLPPLDKRKPGRCVRGLRAAPPRPDAVLVRELTDAVKSAERAHAACVKLVAQAATDKTPIAAAMKAGTHGSAVCSGHAEILRSKLRQVRATIAAAVDLSLSAEECGHHRTVAEAFLAAETPWAGDAGLQRRNSAIARLGELTSAQKDAEAGLKRSERALLKAKLDLQSGSDEDDNVSAQLTYVRAARDSAMSKLLAATAAVQEWATSGEGARALKAFPCDAELTAALTALFEAAFTAKTELPQTPSVELAVEYPGGLAKSPAAFVYFADRHAPHNAARVPVVLRRLRLDSSALMDEAARQLRDAGRIAVGLPKCLEDDAGCPPIVKATRWFVAKGPEGGSADAWLEFPRAPFGTLAEAVAKRTKFSASAGTGLVLRLVRAVARMHAAGIRHGDLNPSNVVLWDDPGSSVVRPGIIDLLDTAVMGATRTLRGATLAWLPPEAKEALTKGDKAYGTRQLDCWQIGRICVQVLDASVPATRIVDPVRAAVATLCHANQSTRRGAAEVLHEIEVATATATSAAVAVSSSLQWVLPPSLWRCRRGAAEGVDFVALDVAKDSAARVLAACATRVRRRVRAVYRLENVQLWQIYVAERARVAKEAQGAPWPERLTIEAARAFAPRGAGALAQEPQCGAAGGEALLVHGATASHQLIARHGFDPSYSGDNAGSLFGAATCLTPSWTKAVGYANGAGAGVFITRAAVGRVADRQGAPRRETSRYRRPPDGHHSVLGDNGSHGAVVAMYRPSQMYPEYLVVFDD